MQNDNEYRAREEVRLELMAQIRRNRVNAQLDPDAGYDTRAFGRYKCRDSECGHAWFSWAARREYGQACRARECQSKPIVRPFEVHAIHWFICRPCARIWTETNEGPRRCPNPDCRVVVASSGLSRPIVFELAQHGPQPTEDSKNPHIMSLCQLCLILNEGRVSVDWKPCYRTSYWREIRAGRSIASAGEPNTAENAAADA